MSEPALRRWSTADEAERSVVGRGFPPGWPLGNSVPAPKREPAPIKVVVPVPEPTIWAREATKDETPGGARVVANAAQLAGFTITVRYARGPRVEGDGTFVEMSDSIVVKMAHKDGRYAVAGWITKTAMKGKNAGISSWSREFGYIATPTIEAADSKELRAYMLPVTNH